jgi:hypothetical protein
MFVLYHVGTLVPADELWQEELLQQWQQQQKRIWVFPAVSCLGHQ